LRQYKPNFVITYVGHINGPHRGIHTLLEAAAQLLPEMPDLKILAGATRPDYQEQLMALIDHYHLHGVVDWTGWVDETQFANYIEAADICICPHVANKHTDHTFPNKVYLYHLFEKPVIVSDCKPLRRYMEDTQGGLIFQSEHPEQLADCIRVLYQNMSLRKQYGNIGRQAVLSKFNWQVSQAKLLEVYQYVKARLPVKTI
jgi:glycosyltransferase involved in cell wall biosynthesis